MLRPRPELRIAAACLPLACVLPAGGATGVELTWTLREANAVDGDDARRLRSCAGAGLDRVVLAVADTGDPARRREFTRDCASGNPSPSARATEVPEIFLDLRAGDYELVATAVDAGDAPRAAAAAAATVELRGVTPVDLELVRPLQPLELDLTGACTDTLTAALRYAAPDADLFLDDVPAPPTVYRRLLASDRALLLGGAPQPCAAVPPGLHTVPDLDPGRYVLDLEIDGRPCAIPVTLEDSPVRIALDLEKPACGR